MLPLLREIKLFSIAALTVLSFNSYKLGADAAPPEPNHEQLRLLSQSPESSPLRIRFRLPSRGAPTGTVGGAVRGKKPLAILPETNLGLTASNSPVIFVYVPENKAVLAELTLGDQDQKEIYRTSLPVSQQEGILMLKLPEEVNLSVEKQYNWRFSLVSNHNDLKRLSTGGWLEKVAQNKNITDAQSKEIETWKGINLLAEEGLWYDTLEQLALLHLENPEDEQIKLEWTELLKSVGLEQRVAESPIFPYVIQVVQLQVQP
jgi:hypothetical protein